MADPRPGKRRLAELLAKRDRPFDGWSDSFCATVNRVLTGARMDLKLANGITTKAIFVRVDNGARPDTVWVRDEVLGVIGFVAADVIETSFPTLYRRPKD